MSENKFPGNPLSLILGIGAILFSVASFYGSFFKPLFSIIIGPPLIMSIIGIVVANKSLRL